MAVKAGASLKMNGNAEKYGKMPRVIARAIMGNPGGTFPLPLEFTVPR